MIETLLGLISPTNIITTVDTLGVIAVIFMETGLFFGFFLPGDSLLFTAGFFAWQGNLPLWVLLVGTFVAAVLGDNTGYLFGKKIGPKIFSREKSLFFDREHITKAQLFYEKHGRKTIILARFIPIIRTFAPIVAGVGNMEYKTFLIFNMIGGFIWTWGVLLAGYFFGAVVPNAEKYILPAVIVIILVSASPALKHIFIEWKKRMKNL